jgi:hypothetical protein
MYVIKFVSKIVLTIESLFHENFMKEKKKKIPFSFVSGRRRIIPSV